MFIENLDKEILAKPLQLVNGIIERKQSLPILSNVLIENQNGSLYFTTTDLEIQITTSINIDLQCNDNLSFTVGGKKLLDILKVLSEQCKINIEVTDNKLQIRTKKSRFNLQTLPAEDFPKLNNQLGENTKRITLPQKDLKHLLHSVQYAMAQQDVRYYLNGMLLVIENNILKTAATDGHRLAYNEVKLSKLDFLGKEGMILPRKTVLELTRLLADNEDPIDLEFSQHQIKAVFSGITVVSKIIDGKFPDYERVIPKYNNNLIMERNVILQALQRAAILCNDKIRGVRFILTEKNLCIMSSNSEQEEAQEDIETDYHGEALDIGFNINYLTEGLLNMNSHTITFSFGDPNSSILISNPNDYEFRYIVMPMRI